MSTKPITPEEGLRIFDSSTSAEMFTATQLYNAFTRELFSRYGAHIRESRDMNTITSLAITCVYLAGRAQGVRDERARLADKRGGAK